MSIRGIVVRLAVLLMAATVLVPVGQVEVTAVPVTLSEQLDGLPSVDGPPEDSGAGSGFSTAEADGPAVSTSEIVETPLVFSSVGVRAPESATAVRARTSADGETWSDWEALEFIEATDGPDDDSAEAREAESGQHTEPLWVGEASHLQLEVDGAATEELDVTLIDAMGNSGGPVERSWDTNLGSSADADTLNVISRAQWGADESLGSDRVTIADEVHMGIVHHTAHRSGSAANNYSRSEAPGIMRAMHRYHTEALGWRDLGYNVVVDRFGNVYEGRKGGFERGVVGAHAAGFNTGSFGVSVIGNFTNEQASSAALEALTQVVGIKSAIHGINPNGWTNQVGDNSWQPTIVGHRDVGNTACPGQIHDVLDDIRDGAQEHDGLFPDVSPSSVHREAILRLAVDGVTRGCDTNRFCPSDELSRAQAAAFVVRAFELDPIPGSQFPDVPEDHIHAGAINVLASEGWLKGYTDGTFGPWDKMTRGQLATVLARGAGLDDPFPMPFEYPDVPRTHSHAGGIYALYESGVRGNCGSGNFCPNDLALRDSTASFVDMVRELKREEEARALEDEQDDEFALDEDVIEDDAAGEDDPDDDLDDDLEDDGSDADDGHEDGDGFDNSA